MSPSHSKNITPFLPDQTFMQQNHEAIAGLFAELAHDFPDRTVTVDGHELSANEALQLDESGELTPAARQWLDEHTVGKQHGYDRPDDRARKIFIPSGDKKYMGHLSRIHAGDYNFVEGGPVSSVSGRNILVGGGFPHLNAGRLRAAINHDYNQLWDVNNVSLLGGQRRRWNDNENEATAETVLARTAQFSDFDTGDRAQRKKLTAWQASSPFAREESSKPEGPAWEQAYATEAEMGRLALELAMLRADDELFDWGDYPVIEHADPAAREQVVGGFYIPPRTICAWEYITNSGKSFYVINGAAVARDKNGEPRPTSASVVGEAYDQLRDAVSEHENVIAFGAPHIRAAYHTASELICKATEHLQPMLLSIDRWEAHEPPVTGIASIGGMDTADKRLRAAIAA